MHGRHRSARSGDVNITPFSFPRTVGVLAVVSLLAACGGGGDEASVSTDPPSPATTSAGAASSTPATDAASVTDAPASTAPASTFPPAEAMPELTFAPLSAGPIQLTATRCVVDALPFGEPDVAVESIAFDATHAYLPASGGIAVYAVTAGPECALVPAADRGVDGLLATGDEVDSVAATAGGRVIGTGLFGSTVFDTALGQSFECSDVTGEVDISPDGTTVITSFFGSPVERFVLTDTTCTADGEVPLPAELTDPVLVRFDPSAPTDLLVGASDAADTTVAVKVAGGVSGAGTIAWAMGNAEVGGPGWMGWVHGMVPCGTGYCVVDTNTDQLVITDGAGVLRASFVISELIGQRLFYDDLQLGPDGAPYLLASTSVDDGAGGSNEGNYLIRLEITG
jgi:hypothetical protein